MKIIECPRDAMQGLHDFIPTETKVEYINTLLKVGFDTIDFGSFVSPKAIPQMRDTWKVLARLDLDETESKLLAIVANERGANDALEYEQINYLGFPFSISETFQQRNTNASQEEAYDRVKYIFDRCKDEGKELIIYLSMGFGNPYGDFWDPAIVEHWADRFISMGVETISLSDTVGVATPDSIGKIFSSLIESFPKVEFGAHLHTHPADWEAKVTAAYDNGCRRFDGAMKGFGGCPFAQDSLVGNMPTEKLIQFLEERDIIPSIDYKAFEAAKRLAMSVFRMAA